MERSEVERSATSTSWLRPAALGRAPRVHVIAPSGPIVEREVFDRGLALLERSLGRPCTLASNIFCEDGYFAGDDAMRLAALQEALADPSIDALIAGRGGYGLTRLLHRLDPEPLRRAPKLIIGFSDTTALLVWALGRDGVTAIHGPSVQQLATLPEDDRERLISLARGEDPGALVAEEGAIVRGGRVQGWLLAGNIEVLRSLVGTPAMPSLSGAILALEELGERPYRIDRALTQLIRSGALRGVRGVMVGQLTGCEEPPGRRVQSPTAHEVVVERLSTLGVPVVTGFDFGHALDRHAALPVGGLVELNADHGALYMLEPVTAPPRETS